jgi:DNA-binding transcriptional MerR regulator
LSELPTLNATPAPSELPVSESPKSAPVVIAPQERFTTRDVLRLTGATARQLQWWDEKHIVAPARQGRKRIYSVVDLIEIHVIEELRRRRISLKQVRRVLKFLRREMQVRLGDLVAGKTDHHLLIDGKRLYLETDSQQIVDLIRNTRQPVFVVCLSDAVRRIYGTPSGLEREELPAKKPSTSVQQNDQERSVTVEAMRA